jgi:diguanylate cyclase (GGDEF)-like protein
MASGDKLSDVLSEFARTMVTSFPIQAILDHLVERIVDVLPVSAAGVTLISPGVYPHYIAASDSAALRYEELQTELGEGPCLLAYQTDHAVVVPDLRLEDRFARFSSRAVAAGLQAVFTFPLRHGDHRLGALDLYRDVPGELSADSLIAAQTLADVAAAYLLNAQARAALEVASERSREAALHDPLTGLPNRILLLEFLEHALNRGRRSGKRPGVFFIDLDRFKAVNDRHGHQIGDNLLVAVAGRLIDMLRPGDSAARLSGDEFAVVCEDLDSSVEASRIASRLAAGLAEPFQVSGRELNVTASIGMALPGDGESSAETLIHQADIAMYKVKRRGGRSFSPLRPDGPYSTAPDFDLDHELGVALARGELCLQYQPVVTTREGRMTGLEVLPRWAHPRRGLVSPAVLLPLAEHSGLSGEIGQWVLGQAWTEKDSWLGQHRHALAISAKVSAHQLMSAGFVTNVEAVLGLAGGGPNLLTLEVSERVLALDSERALIVLNDVKGLGVTLALGEFATGGSSLKYLKHSPFDVMKIDRTFVAGLGRDPASQAIVGSLAQLAHGLGMTIVAEGVETADQVEGLVATGCDSCQGLYFAAPMSVDDLGALVRQISELGLRLPIVSGVNRG